jgi:hypothetical protein
MRIKTIVITIVILIGIILFSVLFMNKEKSSKTKDLPPGTHEVTVSEVIQTTKYTYLLSEENGNEFWIAVNRRDAAKGDVIYYTNPLEMKNFVSKELGRTFPVVYFVQDVSDKPIVDQNASPQNASPQNMAPKKPEIVKMTGINIKPVTNGITISELYEHQEKYAGKTVKIRGQVTRYNPMVMGKNWAHIQDGTEYSGQFDLTVTTMDSVSVGNVITATGIVSLKKDFGSGYYYAIIMEEAKVTEIKQAE